MLKNSPYLTMCSKNTFPVLSNVPQKIIFLPPFLKTLIRLSAEKIFPNIPENYTLNLPSLESLIGNLVKVLLKTLNSLDYHITQGN